MVFKADFTRLLTFELNSSGSKIPKFPEFNLCIAYLQLNIGSAAHFPIVTSSESPGFVNEHVEDWTDHIFVVQEIENPLHVTTHVLIQN